MKRQDLYKPLSEDLEQLARKRAGRRMGWFIHLLVFFSVNLLLAVVAGASGRLPGFAPLWGWGMGLAIHGVVVLLSSGTWGLHEKLLRAERHSLASSLSER